MWEKYMKRGMERSRDTEEDRSGRCNGTDEK